MTGIVSNDEPVYKNGSDGDWPAQMVQKECRSMDRLISYSICLCFHPNNEHKPVAPLQNQSSINMSPERGQFQKENSFPTRMFQGICLISLV